MANVRGDHRGLQTHIRGLDMVEVWIPSSGKDRLIISLAMQKRNELCEKIDDALLPMLGAVINEVNNLKEIAESFAKVEKKDIENLFSR